VRQIQPKNVARNNGYVSDFGLTLPATASGWLAVRCIGTPIEAGGIPFAHTGPWHVDMPSRPSPPKRREVQYFLQRVEEEIERNRNVLTADQLADYFTAREFWRQKLKEAGDPAGPGK
jgi:hypothetical protein